MGFQTVVNVELGFGIPGALYSDAPVRSQPAALVSASAAYNVIGATAYTVTTADPGDNSAPLIAAAGGSGAFAGILMNSKVYATSGPSTGALNPTMTLPNNFIAELCLGGDLIVSIPGPANIGDLVAYDLTTGALQTYPEKTTFTAAIAGTTGTLTVSAVSAGQLQVGQLISGTNVPPGIYITGVTTGLGNTGTYTTNYAATAAVASTAMSATSLPPAAAAFTAAVSTTGVLSVTAVTSGELAIGQVIYGTNVPANSVIVGLGTGVGGTGTYTLSQIPATAITAEAMTADATAQVPNARVYRFNPAGGGVGVIKINN